MPTPKSPPTDAPTDAPTDTPVAGIRMRHETNAATTTLAIGTTMYSVTDGLVVVDPDHVDAAMQAGFRPA